MWIHITSNETGWEMPKTGEKRSRKQGKGNPRGRTRADQDVTTSNGESAKDCSLWLKQSTSPAQSRNLSR